jgi:hypothetical protein
VLRGVNPLMWTITGFLTLWLCVWLIEQTRRKVGPLQLLVCWVIHARAASLLVLVIWRHGTSHLSRWQEVLDFCRLDVVLPPKVNGFRIPNDDPEDTP